MHTPPITIGLQGSSLSKMLTIRKIFLYLVCFVGVSTLLDVLIISSYDVHAGLNINCKFKRLSFLLSNGIPWIINGEVELPQTIRNKERAVIPWCGKRIDKGGVAVLNRGSDSLHVPPVRIPTNSELQLARKHLLHTTPTQINILLWNKFHGFRKWWHTSEDRIYRQCGRCSCVFLYDKRLTMDVDAVMFEYNDDMLRLKPHRHIDLPLRRKPEQYWILYNHEPHHSNQKVKSNFLFNNLDNARFNLSANYRNEADIILKYGECFPRPKQNYSTKGVNFAANKTRLAVWFVCNCRTTSGRIEYVNELNQHIHVDTAGKCGDYNVSSIIGTVRFVLPVTEINKYKFYLAFENTFCDQYISEKVFKILHDEIRVVPIVRGAGPYHKYLPPGSYIDVADFSTPKDLADYLYKLDNNDTLYNDYFKPRKHFLCRNNFSSRYTWPCKVCNSVCQMKKNGTREVLEKDEIAHLFSPLRTCRYP